ncbi:MAG: peptidylprolyl isomerase [Hyphomonadaceae bacterium]|nr:peptidylprolyl isomerase [Hyphomonadaceae bacterium]MBC6413001.1 peptidylprolyl isomerase [Hyphomonadaceae bacterium]
MKLLIKGVVFAGIFDLVWQSSAPAQQAHGIAAVVNDDIVTSHDLRQRVLFMAATTGVQRTEESITRLQTQALRNLIDEKIQIQEADKYEQEISDEEIDRAVTRLISRNGLDPQEVAGRLASAGISMQTLRDQVKSEIAWQRIINGLYGSRIRISDAQINETVTRLSFNASRPSYRVAEIFIESAPDIGGLEGALEGARAMIAQINQGAPFPLLAQQFSSSPTAARGGDVGWVREGELRPEIDAVITQMQRGELSGPIQVPGGVYVVSLLAKQVSGSETVYKLKQINFETDTDEARQTAKSELIALKGTFKSCDALASGVNQVEGLNQADMGELKASDIQDAVLEKLVDTDIGELTDPIETSAGVAAILVCDRRITGVNVPTRDEVENRLMDQQLAQASRRHLRDLRRQATIVVR